MKTLLLTATLMVTSAVAHTEIPTACDPESHFVNGMCQAKDDCTSNCVAPKACNLLCSQPLDIVGDALDCTVYYICDASNTPQGPFHCDTEAPYFNGEKCTTDESQCC
ncbi:uncharacterized protein LOC123509315 [Portunus trituberculatus]|uniref:uncharacterized protein LOC123509315 n=1 Tax=Portunus trituberculatus TaxID=210409 RepID=UPI001E1CD4BE|nr:uncharacterized protein LOC123509315 [Portunus trituberculatus]